MRNTIAQIELAKLIEHKAKIINITAIRDYDSIWKKHIHDSLEISEIKLLNKLLLKGVSVLDLGSGGGIPGLPLAIDYSKSNFTLLDARRKKIDVINEFVNHLGLSNVKTVWGRAEEQTQLFSSFDIVVSRAVAYLPTLIMLSLPSLKKDGLLVFWKSNNPTEIKSVNSEEVELIEKHEYTLEDNFAVMDRVILVYKKL